MAITPSEINVRFSPVATEPDRVAIKNEITAAARELALLINRLVPGCREESAAVTAVEHAVQWAHAGIDRRYVPRAERRPAPATAEAQCLAAMADADLATRPDRL